MNFLRVFQKQRMARYCIDTKIKCKCFQPIAECVCLTEHDGENKPTLPKFDWNDEAWNKEQEKTRRQRD